MTYNPQDDVTPLPAGTALAVITDPRNYVRVSDTGQHGQIWIVLAVLAGLVVVGSLMLATSTPTPAQAEQIASLNTPLPPTGTPSPTVTATATPYYTPTMNPAEAEELRFIQTRNAVTQVAIGIQMTADKGNLIITQAAQVSTRTALDATAQAGVAEITASAKLDAAQLSAALTNIPLAVTATIQARTVIAQAAQRDADITSTGLSFGTVLVVALICAGIGLLITKIGGALKAQELERAFYAKMNTRQNAPPEARPVVQDEVAQVNKSSGGGYGESMQYGICTAAEKHTIKRQLKAGRKLTLQEDTGMIPERNGFSRLRLEQIIENLVTAEMCVRKATGAVEFTQAGLEYFGISD